MRELLAALTGIHDIDAYWVIRDKLLNKRRTIALKYAAKMIRRRYGSGIPITEKINPFIAPHGFYGIFISLQASVGSGCTIYQQVTIGSNRIPNTKRGGGTCYWE